jgi:hypothetical protein
LVGGLWKTTVDGDRLVEEEVVGNGAFIGGVAVDSSSKMVLRVEEETVA